MVKLSEVQKCESPLENLHMVFTKIPGLCLTLTYSRFPNKILLLKRDFKQTENPYILMYQRFSQQFPLTHFLSLNTYSAQHFFSFTKPFIWKKVPWMHSTYFWLYRRRSFIMSWNTCIALVIGATLLDTTILFFQNSEILRFVAQGQPWQSGKVEKI